MNQLVLTELLVLVSYFAVVYVAMDNLERMHPLMKVLSFLLVSISFLAIVLILFLR